MLIKTVMSLLCNINSVLLVFITYNCYAGCVPVLDQYRLLRNTGETQVIAVYL